VTEPGRHAATGPRHAGGALSLPGETPPAHHRPDGRFRNPWPEAELRPLRDLLRWGLTRSRRSQAPPVDRAILAPIRGAAAPRPAAAPTVSWIGHSTVLLQLAGRAVITDPMFGDRASPVRFAGPRRWAPPGLPLDRLPAIDAVLMSHNHYDHLDAPSVRAIAAQWPEADWHAPLGLARVLRRLGARRVTEHDWWEERDSGPLRLTATPAQHFSGRTPFDRNRTLWCGWSVATTGASVFFAGDTGYHPEFGAIGRRLGPFDVALLPIGAYDPRWFMRPVHMDPEEAVRALVDLRGPAPHRVALLPLHWGTFKLTDEPMDEPPRRVRAAWLAAGLPPDDLWLLRPGETRVLGG
jgi:N-acyl-phosphatidylethanolamine-hydrolysing phospholipase D